MNHECDFFITVLDIGIINSRIKWIDGRRHHRQLYVDFTVIIIISIRHKRT